MLSTSRSDLHTFSMEPLLADVAANPELISPVTITTSPASGFALFIIILLFQFFLLIFWL
jgi:hypothetical protein